MSNEMVEAEKPMLVEEYLNSVSYEIDPNYVPSEFALELVIFIKMVEGGDPENKTPVVHYHMIDKFIADGDLDVLNMCHRGIAKSTLKEYLILYLGVYGELPNFGKVPFALYVSDSIENGVKKMRKSLEFRYDHSPFLQEYIPKVKFTDLRWEFINKDGNSFVVSGYGAKTGVRGTRENGSRPVLALLDDLISDEDARSDTVIKSVTATINNAIEAAMHPTKRKIIWSGTPFNARDPLYKAVESGAWLVNVFPVCERFPCTREEFKGSWPDRFTYDAVNKAYTKALKQGNVAAFNQEMMLRIISDDEKIILDSDLRSYDRDSLLRNKGNFNFYITTDFATSEKSSADYSFISVWAYNAIGDWFWIEGVCKKQQMSANVNDLFRLAQKYMPQSVGVEVSGQQAGFIPWIQEEMGNRNIWFTLASQGNSNQPGLRPSTSTSKIERFMVTEPWFKAGKMHFPANVHDDVALNEIKLELSLVTKGGFKSKYDDGCDTISQLPLLNAWKPSQDTPQSINDSGDAMWDDEDADHSSTGYDDYTV